VGPPLAHASPAYPVAVQADLKLTETPRCTLCHTTDLGGKGTISSYFGRTLLRDGAQGNDDIGALKAALEMMESEQTDSDGDGVSDIDELRAGTDPNDGPGPSDPLPTPQTGCALRGAAQQGASGSAWLWCALGAYLVRRRRARGARLLRNSEAAFRKSEA
jgi:Bacterial TSP3 repeat